MRLTAAALAALLVVTPAAPAFAEDLEILLVNMSDRALAAFYTSPSGEESWEEDVFGDGYLPSGNQVPVIIADGRDVCYYDLAFVMEDGAELEAYGYDLCEEPTFTLYDE
jgi:hypothetical protein